MGGFSAARWLGNAGMWHGEVAADEEGGGVELGIFRIIYFLRKDMEGLDSTR